MDFYIYAVKTNIENVGIGNDSTHDEYTVHNNGFVWHECDEICRLDLDNIFQYIEAITEENYRKIVNDHTRYLNNRGLLSYLMIREYGYQSRLNKNIIKVLFSYDWKKFNTEEIMQVMKENNLHFYQMHSIKRIMWKGKRN